MVFLKCNTFVILYFVDAGVHKSLLEALILASTNPRYDKRLFIELTVQHIKTTSPVNGNSMNTLMSYCGLIDAKKRPTDKDLPVPDWPRCQIKNQTETLQFV